MDQFDQQYFIYSNFNEFRKIDGFETVMDNHKNYWDTAEDLMKYINHVSEELIDIDALSQSNNYETRFIVNLIKKYEELRKANNYLDFASIQVETYNLLKNNPSVLKFLQEKIKYLMVDEYQDTNYIQEQLSFMISKNGKVEKNFTI